MSILPDSRHSQTNNFVLPSHNYKTLNECKSDTTFYASQSELSAAVPDRKYFTLTHYKHKRTKIESEVYDSQVGCFSMLYCFDCPDEK